MSYILYRVLSFLSISIVVFFSIVLVYTIFHLDGNKDDGATIFGLVVMIGGGLVFAFYMRNIGLTYYSFTSKLNEKGASDEETATIIKPDGGRPPKKSIPKYMIFSALGIVLSILVILSFVISPFILFFSGIVVLIASYLMILVGAFKESVFYGILCILMGPIGLLIYLYNTRKIEKKELPFQILISGLGLVISGAILAERPLTNIRHSVPYFNLSVAGVKKQNNSAYHNLAKSIVNALNNRSESAITDNFDLRPIVEKVNRKLKVEGSLLDVLKTTIRTILVAGSYEDVKSLPSNNAVKLIRVKIRNNKAFVLVRLNYGGDGVTYIEYVLSRSEDSVVIIDWNDFGSGYKYSDYITEMWSFIYPNKAAITSLLSGRRTVRQRIIMDISANVKQKKFSKVYADYKLLDVKVRRQKILANIMIKHAHASGLKNFQMAVLEDMFRYHSNDMGLLLFEYYLLKKKYRKAIAAAKKSMEQIKISDPLMNSLIANLYLKTGNIDQAIQMAVQSLNLEPSLFLPHRVLFDSYILKNNYRKASLFAKMLKEKFSFDLSRRALSKNPIYAKFLLSSEYRNIKK